MKDSGQDHVRRGLDRPPLALRMGWDRKLSNKWPQEAKIDQKDSPLSVQNKQSP